MSTHGHNQGQSVPSQYAAVYAAYGYGGRDDTDLQGGPRWVPNGSSTPAVSNRGPEYHPPLYASDASMRASNATHGYVVDPDSRGFPAEDQYRGAVGRASHDQGHAAVFDLYANTYTDGQQNRTDGISHSAGSSVSPSSTLVNIGSCVSSTIQDEQGSHNSRDPNHFGVSIDPNVANHPSMMMGRFLNKRSPRSEVQDSLQQYHTQFPQARSQDASVEYAQDLRISSSESDDGEKDDKHGEISHKSKRKARTKSKYKSSRVKWKSTSEEKKGKNDKYRK